MNNEKILLIIDCETNGLTTDYSVLSASAIKLKYNCATKEFITISTFDRYYYPREIFLNYEAIAVNRLDYDVIEEKRKDCTYPLFFINDKEWNLFIKDVDFFVGHNVWFDYDFMIKERSDPEPFRLLNLKLICTMNLNTDIIRIPFNRSQFKWPSLWETAEYYNIEFDGDKLHSSMYDCQIVLEILKKMLERDLIKCLQPNLRKII